MVRTHFVIVLERTESFVNMAKLFLYSLRKNGGKLSDAPVTVVSNGDELSKDQVETLESFGKTSIRIMPRMGGTPHTNKFSAFYAVDRPYDVMIYMDCDTVTMNELAGIVEDIDPDTKSFKAIPIGDVGANSIRNYHHLVERFALSGDDNLSELRDQRFPNGYPLFNSGVMILTRPAVDAIRGDAEDITYRLYEDYLRKNSLPFPLSELIGGGIWSAGWERLLWRTRTGADYKEWMTEQLGIALAVLKNDVHVEVLNTTYNWTSDDLTGDDDLPGVYHYMKGLHDIEREDLFSGDWIRRYESSGSPLRRELARLARSYPE